MLCKFNHDGDCCNSGATQYMCKCKQPCDTIIPVTNADRIRAMTDEELAALPKEWSGYSCVFMSRECGPENSCEKCLLEWLQQPAEGETHE